MFFWYLLRSWSVFDFLVPEKNHTVTFNSNNRFSSNSLKCYQTFRYHMNNTYFGSFEEYSLRRFRYNLSNAKCISSYITQSGKTGFVLWCLLFTDIVNSVNSVLLANFFIPFQIHFFMFMPKITSRVMKLHFLKNGSYVLN